MPTTYISAYADDTHIFVSHTDQISAAETEAEMYMSFSGGQLNKQKCSCLMLGNWKTNPPVVKFHKELHGAKILGIHFGNSTV